MEDTFTNAEELKNKDLSESFNSESDSDSDLDDSSDDEEYLEKERENTKLLNEIKQNLNDNPLSYDLHVKYIEKLREMGIFEELRTARKNMKNIYPLSETLWLEWISDEKRVACTPEEKKEVLNLYESSFKDYYSINVWKEYLEYVIDEYNTSKEEEEEPLLNVEEIRKLCEKAINVTKFDLTNSHIIWNIYKDFELKLLEENPSPERVKAINDMFLNRLKTPHYDIDQTLASYSNFQSNYDNANYEKNLIAASNKVSKVRYHLKDRQKFEDKIQEEPTNINNFYNYINYELNQKLIEVKQTKILFEKAISIHCLDSNLWNKYILFIINKMNVKSVLLSICERAIRNCPWSGKLWDYYANAKKLHNCTNEEILDVYNQALNNQLIMNDMNNYIEVVKSKIKYELNEVNWKDNEKIEYFRNVFNEKIVEIETYFNPGDPMGRIEKLWIDTELKCFNDIEQAKKLYETFTKKIGTNTELWLSYIDFEKQQKNYEIIGQLFKSNYKRHLDNPMKFLNQWNHYNQNNSNIKSFFEFQYLIELYKQKLENDGIYDENQTDEYMYQQYYQYQQLQKHRESKQKEKSKEITKRKRENDHDKNQSNKKRKDKINENAKANIENKSKEELVENKNNDNEIIQNNNSDQMEIENEEKKEKNEIKEEKPKMEFKKPEKEKPWLNKNENPETVFVNKLPPTITKNELREIFKKYGNIKDIRLMYRSNRAFAYIDYETSEESHACLEMNDTEINGKKIQVAISNPSLKKTEISEIKQDNKELYISNLPFTIEIEKLKEIFSKYGEVKDIRLITKANKQPVGTGFIEYVDKESAFKGLAVNGTEIDGRIINVTISNNRNRNAQKQQQRQQQQEKKKAEQIKPMLPRRMVNHSFQNRPATKLKISNKKSTNKPENKTTNNETESKPTSVTSKSNDDFRKLLGL
ncbi:hypothetical protein BCR32DRAFT_250596 [Anaeromyces robustus]|uniref:RRM domain-containing protein n=1 Tax=Anaeromyces robustus TaxID=1754192 RepID=A0A1Y1VXM5_9FUNG|nr:hypothetical protein BCR32DRAFT_250596 [Anaeromyces robustus]|eukprot:ORX65766.1 hypothetical protein BCR32DRAFT_250596 [Anaeromyces robustus]